MDADDDQETGFLARIARCIAPLVHHAAISLIMGVLSVSFTAFELLGDVSPWILGAVFGGTVFYFALNLLTDKFVSLSLRLTMLGITIRVMGLTIADRAAAAKEMAVSLSYLGALKGRNARAKGALLVCSTALAVLAFRFPEFELLNAAMVSTAALGLLFLKEVVVEYRIRNGLFGTTRSEARDLIDFLVKNSDDIDFTDSNGNLRRALLPEKQQTNADNLQPAAGGAAV